MPSFGVVPVKMAKSSGATFSKIQVDVASKYCQVVKNDRILADEWPFQHFLETTRERKEKGGETGEEKRPS